MGGLFSAEPNGGSHAAATALPPKATAAPAQMSEHDRAVMQMKITRDKLQKTKKKLEKDNEMYVKKAKELMKQGHKDKAMVALRMKKYKEKQTKQLEGQLDNVNQMLSSVETAETTNRVMKALDAGNQALKRLNDELPIEKVEAIMQDSADAIAYQNEVTELLTKNLSEDDDLEVDDELKAMQAEMSGFDHLPVAPTTKIKTTGEPDRVPLGEQAQPTRTRVLEGA